MKLDDLRAYGADVEEGLARCMNNESFYLRMVGLAKVEKNIDVLYAAADAGDVQGMFAAAHALKGVMGNLALTPLFAPASELTELLRGKTEVDDETLAAALNLAASIRTAHEALLAIE